MSEFNPTADLTVKTRNVATHFNPDVDSLMTVCLWAYLIGVKVRELTVRFVPAGIKAVNAGEIGLDIGVGLKGIESSAFEALLAYASDADREALARLARHVTAQDQGEMFKLDPVVQVGTLGGTLLALRVAGMKDDAMLEWAEPIFLANLVAGRARVSADKALAEATWLSGRRICVLPANAPGGATAAAFDAGADFAVYTDGLNVGMVRSSKVTEPHLGQLLGPDLPPGLYLDERGFMVCWGSRKSPATEPSPISGLELGELLSKKLGG